MDILKNFVASNNITKKINGQLTDSKKIHTYMLSFQGHTLNIWMFPGWGSKHSCSRWPTLQQHQIQTASMTYTTGHINTGSLPTKQGQRANLCPHGYQSDFFFLLSHKQELWQKIFINYIPKKGLILEYMKNSCNFIIKRQPNLNMGKGSEWTSTYTMINRHM